MFEVFEVFVSFRILLILDGFGRFQALKVSMRLKALDSGLLFACGGKVGRF